MTGLSWLEGAAAEGGSPLKRLAAAQYRLLGSTFGLVKPEATKAPEDRSVEADPVRERGDEMDGARGRSGPRPERALRIQHHKGARRAVRVQSWELAPEARKRKVSIKITFYSQEEASSAPVAAELVLNGKNDATLKITTPRAAPPGLWRAAICEDSSGIQIGVMDIVL
jgi:hypothetical protein